MSGEMAHEAEIERACEVMHDAYEAAAADAGWETQERSRKPWADVPEANRATMRAAVTALLDHLAAARGDRRECGWLGCGHPACAELCAGIPLREWWAWRDDHDYATADVRPRTPDSHSSLWSRLRRRYRPAMTTTTDRSDR